MTEEPDADAPKTSYTNVKLVTPPPVLGLNEKARAEFLASWDEDVAR